jgi:hypothetical protein
VAAKDPGPAWSRAAPVAVLEGVTRERFEAEVVPAGRPVILRGLVRDWPIVAAARVSDPALADYLNGFPAHKTVQSWFGPPGIEGRFGYSDDLTGFNHERRVLRLDELLAYMLRARDDPAAHTAYAGGVPVGPTVPDLLPHLPMPLLEAGREMLVSLWLGGRSRTAAHWDVPQNLACVVAGRRRFTLLPTEQVANLYVGRWTSPWRGNRSAWWTSPGPIWSGSRNSPRPWTPPWWPSSNLATRSTCPASGGTTSSRWTASGRW